MQVALETGHLEPMKERLQEHCRVWQNMQDENLEFWHPMENAVEELQPESALAEVLASQVKERHMELQDYKGSWSLEDTVPWSKMEVFDKEILVEHLMKLQSGKQEEGVEQKKDQ